MYAICMSGVNSAAEAPTIPVAAPSPTAPRAAGAGAEASKPAVAAQIPATPPERQQVVQRPPEDAKPSESSGAVAQPPAAEAPAEPTAESEAPGAGEPAEPTPRPHPDKIALPNLTGVETATDLVHAADARDAALADQTGNPPHAEPTPPTGGPSAPTEQLTPEQQRRQDLEQALQNAQATFGDAERAWIEAGQPPSGTEYNNYTNAKLALHEADINLSLELTDQYVKGLIESQRQYYVGPFAVGSKEEADRLVQLFADINNQLGIDTSREGSGFEFMLADALRAAWDASPLRNRELNRQLAEGTIDPRLWDLLALLQNKQQNNDELFDGTIAGILKKMAQLAGRFVVNLAREMMQAGATSAPEQTAISGQAPAPAEDQAGQAAPTMPTTPRPTEPTTPPATAPATSEALPPMTDAQWRSVHENARYKLRKGHV